MTEFVKKYFPNAVQMDRLCNCCNQPMYNVAYPTTVTSKTTGQTLVGHAAQCLNNDCWQPEVEGLGYE